MAKMRQTINGATIECEGDERTISACVRMFHHAIAEQALREVESQLASLRPLQRQRQALKKVIAELSSPKTMETPQAADAVARVVEKVTG